MRTSFLYVKLHLAIGSVLY